MRTQTTVKDEVINPVNEVASKETCKNETEVIKSKTVLRIIEIIEKLTIENNNTTEKLEKPEKPISVIYTRFANGYPISQKNIDRLIQFFENNKNQELAKDIMSKIDIKEGDNYSSFIKRFLKSSNSLPIAEKIIEIIRSSLNEDTLAVSKDVQNQIDSTVYKNDSSKFINYVIEKLKKYPYKVDFDFELTQDLEKRYEPYKLFVYKKDGKKSFMIRGDNNLEVTEAIYSSIVYLKTSGIYLGIKKGTPNGSPVDKYSGDILAFNKGKIDNLGTINDLIKNPILDDLNIFYEIEGRKTGYKIIEKDENGKLLKDKLPPIYDKIEVTNGITFASINLDSGKTKLEVYTKNDKKHNFLDIDLYSYIDPNMVMIKKDGLRSYFKIEENGDILAIDFLQNINSFLYPKNIKNTLSNYSKGKPVIIENINGEVCLIGEGGKTTVLEIKIVEKVKPAIEQNSISFKIGKNVCYYYETKKELYQINAPKKSKK